MRNWDLICGYFVEGETIRKGLVLLSGYMVEGVAGVTSGLWTLRDGVKGPGREKEVLGSWVLAVLLTMSGRRGRMPWVGDQGTVYFGTLWIEDSIKFSVGPLTSWEWNKLPEFQSRSIFLWQIGCDFFPPRWGYFKSGGGKGGWEGGGEWGKTAVSFCVAPGQLLQMWAQQHLPIPWALGNSPHPKIGEGQGNPD